MRGVEFWHRICYILDEKAANSPQPNQDPPKGRGSLQGFSCLGLGLNSPICKLHEFRDEKQVALGQGHGKGSFRCKGEVSIL